MNKPLVIFELANNHMGDASHAIDIIKKFKKISSKFKTTIDFAFKFQFRDLDTYIEKKFVDTDHKGVRRFLDTKLSENSWKKIIDNCKNLGFKTICTPFDENSVDKIIKNKFDYLKIASCSVDEWPLLQHIFNKCKKQKIISSLGGASDQQIRNIISFFSKKNFNIQFLYCVAKYPTNHKNLNLFYFKHLNEIYGEKICGFSSHEDPNEKITASLAYAMGARIFEKHIGLKTSKYNLNTYSANLDQIKNWLENLNHAIEICGTIEDRNKFLKEERLNLAQFKRGVYLSKNKKKGNILDINKDVRLSYPSIPGQITGEDISKFKKIILKKNISENKPLLKRDLEIINSRKEIEIIREKISNLIYRANVILRSSSKLEISHHYGIKYFYKFGMCMITIYNDLYCKKLLFLLHKQKHPEQYHKLKQETFFITYGKVKLKLRKMNDKTIKTKILKVGEIFTIYPKEIHSFECLSKNGCVIEELSSKSIKEDSYYIDKKINLNKNRKSIISII